MNRAGKWDVILTLCISGASRMLSLRPEGDAMGKTGIKNGIRLIDKQI